MFGMAAMVSCQNIPFFIGYKSVEGNEWQRKDTVCFELPKSEKTSREYSVGLRTMGSFNYSKVYVAVTLKDSDSIVAIDTVAVDIISESGKPLGNGFPYIETTKKGNIALPLDTGKRYIIGVSQLMRVNPLKGVSDVGVEVY